MATWQYTIELIPRAKLVELFGAVPQAITESDYEETDWWSDCQPFSDYETFIASFVPSCSSWSENVKRWGEEDGNMIETVLDEESVIEISVRIDLRKPDEQFLQDIADFAQRSDCVFLTESLELIEPSVNILKLKLMSSDAARFVADPARYLEEIERSRRVLRTA